MTRLLNFLCPFRFFFLRSYVQAWWLILMSLSLSIYVFLSFLRGFYAFLFYLLSFSEKTFYVFFALVDLKVMMDFGSFKLFFKVNPSNSNESLKKSSLKVFYFLNFTAIFHANLKWFFYEIQWQTDMMIF
jgi:hypothetical protein